MHSIKGRFVTRPSNTQFGGVCTFQPENFTGCGSEGVNVQRTQRTAANGTHSEQPA